MIGAEPVDRSEQPAMAAPFLSIIIPAYNEAERLPATLAQLSAFLRDEAYTAEIVVVDDGSVDGTAAVVQQAAAANPAIRLIAAPHRGKGAAVRRGMLAATGQVRLMCDADLSMPAASVNRSCATSWGACSTYSSARSPCPACRTRSAASRPSRRRARSCSSRAPPSTASASTWRSSTWHASTASASPRCRSPGITSRAAASAPGVIQSGWFATSCACAGTTGAGATPEPTAAAGSEVPRPAAPYLREPMPERILVCVAWPYANGSLHVGHIAGAYLPADIFARFHRLQGHEVLMVSGSDEHGTPITVRAEQEGVPPQVITDRYQTEFLECWAKLGISFDLFTRTGTENHRAVVHEVFRTLLDRGHIFKDAMLSPYCEVDRRFLPDRYVQGTCPHCGYAGARGDQCDQCGRPLNATELLDPRCRLCNTPPVIRETEHLFLDLPAFQEQLLAWVREKHYWRPTVQRFTLGLLEAGLQPRPITRDIEWGVPVPLPGFEAKRIYVWFEAVIGYLSATV